MFHKAVSLFCFVAFISVCFVHEGYPQAQTEQNVSLEEQKEGRTLLVTATTLLGFGSMDREQRAYLRLNQGVKLLDWNC